jgi:hypothetical protein
MSPVKEQRVTLSGDIAGRYIVRSRRRGGALVLEPEITADELGRELGLRKATGEELAEFLAAHEHEMLPPDGEG